MPGNELGIFFICYLHIHKLLNRNEQSKNTSFQFGVFKTLEKK